MAKGKTFTLSITKFLLFAYIVRLLTGQTPRAILENLMNGNIKDSMIELALSTMDRLEADGVEIAVSGSFAVLIQQWFKRAIGNKQLLKVGPLRITP